MLRVLCGLGGEFLFSVSNNKNPQRVSDAGVRDQFQATL